MALAGGEYRLLARGFNLERVREALWRSDRQERRGHFHQSRFI